CDRHRRGARYDQSRFVVGDDEREHRLRERARPRRPPRFRIRDTGCGTACAMIVAANAVIRVTDSDCGPATNIGPAICSGANTNTVADIVCGTNASCSLQSGPPGATTQLAVILTGAPTIDAP